MSELEVDQSPDEELKDEVTVSSSDDTLELGGHIELTGFVNLMPGSMTIIKKIVGTYTKRYNDLVKNFEKLHLTMKPIHNTTDKPKLFHINAKMIYEGKVMSSQSEDRNVFHAIDAALKKIEAEITN
ncbi:hypothetical protein H6503_05515 [Candidatus Woesearchaeota archaeon]|nr:hypothetical protein [Candidatus Woesearchaeota archaeon]